MVLRAGESEVMAVAVTVVQTIHSISGSIGPESVEGVTEKCPTAGNYDWLSQLYIPKMSGVPSQIYMYAVRSRILTTRAPSLFPAAISRDHFIYLRIINAPDADPNEKRTNYA